MFSVGRTSGITAIPYQTLWRYVKEFKEYFSVSAQKSTGKRFTPQDIDKLLLIRHLHYERVDPDRIKAALRGEWVPVAKPQYNTQDALQIVQAAQERFEAIGEHVKQARQAASEARRIVATADQVLKRFSWVMENREQMANYQEQIKALEARLAAMEKATGQQKKRGLFGLGG